ncbi:MULTISPECIES: caspase domain-containing protein [unclassified Mesorhizobium]|uniref:caspase domain-containing protein n=1 Tax=unclassified Mesorhizobium TaxID=325217 RepID=UPI003338F324
MMALRFAIALLLVSLSAQAWAERRVALVIGNSAYRYAVPLSNPKNDAVDMTAKLQALGFEVVAGEDLDLSGMRGTVRDFIGKLDGADMALLFYAGHGVQVNGTNYMAPVDARLSTYNDLDFEAVPMDLVLSAMERTTKVNLVFLDACRDSPFSQNLGRSMGTRSGSVGRGLAKLGTGVGSLIAFATQPGNVALDGEGRNSPFTSALLKNLGTPGQDISRDLINVRRDVLEATDGKQVPWDNSSLTGDVILQPLSGNTAVTAGAKGGDVEVAYWETIKEKTDKRFFEAYLRQYPSGAFAALASLKIDEIEQAATDRGKAPSISIAGVAVAEAHPDLDVTQALADPRALTKATQTELTRVGCLVGQADGKWGPGSRKALQAFAEQRGLKLASLEPTKEVLRAIKNIPERVCAPVKVKAFDGAWALTRRAGNSACDYTEQSTTIFIDGTEISAMVPLAGTITADGAFDIYLSFVDDDGAPRQNHIIGRLQGAKGSGEFSRVGGECAGVVRLDKRTE